MLLHALYFGLTGKLPRATCILPSPVRYLITYGSVEVLAIILGHVKYNDVWIKNVVDLKMKTTARTNQRLGLMTCTAANKSTVKQRKK